ncbi:DUF4430 domain-containing protein [Candidatus Micrarchaeota archaeon]|nr:DUF4430 domain-containing protein [Candidatus Micrarchaeota archaeon]
MKNQVLLLLLLSLALFGCLGTKGEATRNQPGNESIEKLIIFVAVNDGSKVTTKTVEVEKGATALEAFQKAASLNVTYYSGMGAFVTGVNGLEQDAKKGRFWQYYVNGKLAPVGVNNYRVEKNSTILEFRYEAPAFK